MTHMGPNGDTEEIPLSLAVAPLTLISYNLWQGRAQRELPKLVEAYHPDILCVQEAADSLPCRLGPLRLVAATTTTPFQVALYAHDERFTVVDAAPYQLTRSLHDRLKRYSGERLVGAHLRDRQANRDIIAASLHATPLTDPNLVRRVQIDNAHQHLRTLGPGLPLVMAGDFNYPLFTLGLGRHLKKQGFSLARSATSTYHKHGPTRGSFDLATTTGINATEVVTLPQHASDHKPIQLTLEYPCSRIQGGTRSRDDQAPRASEIPE